MTQTPLRSLLRWALCFSAISLISTTGMAGEKRSSSDKRFVLVSSFQSQAPSNDASSADANETSIATPPSLNSYRELPSLTDSTVETIRLRDVESRLRKAEEMFEAGKKALADDKKVDARRLFNDAIDILLEAPSDLNAARERVDRRVQELIDAIYRYDVSRLGAAESPDQFVFDSAPRDRVLEELTFPSDPRLRVKVNDQVGSTQSQLPLEVNDAVLTYIKFFTERGRGTLLAGFRRSGKYRQMIQRVLNEEGVPQELIFLAQVESGFQPRIVSWARCAGMWQFLGARGLEYGLKQDGIVDERLDPEKATRAGARHLRDLYKQFGDWYLAMAAYNCGPGCVDAAVRRSGYADFWKLRELNMLPRETANYVPAIVALTIISKNAADYGVANVVMDPALEHDTIEVSEATNLDLIAAATDRTLEEIRDLNPSLIKALAPKGYALHVPKGTVRSVVAALETIPPQNRAAWRMYRMKDGDTLAGISTKFYVSSASLMAANTGFADAEPGDLLAIPPAAYAPRWQAPAKTNRWRSATRWTGKAVARTAWRPAVKTAGKVAVTATAGKKPAAAAPANSLKPGAAAVKGKSVAQVRRPGVRPGA